MLWSNTVGGVRSLLSLGSIVVGNGGPEQVIHSCWDGIATMVRMSLIQNGVMSYWLGLKWLDAFFAVLGIWHIVIRAKNSHDCLHYRMIGLYALVYATGLVFWTPLAWGRWYLPAVPIVALLESTGIIASATALFALSRTIILSARQKTIKLARGRMKNLAS